MDTFGAYPQSVVIVGASHAGVAAATELRNAGYESEIILVGEEEGMPYHRPHLSKDCLAGEMPAPKPIRPESFYDERMITLRLGTCVTGIDRRAKTLFLAEGGRLSYGVLILATGASARSLPAVLQGAERAAILRDKSDWEALSNALLDKASLAVIGGGLIGLEVAAAARERGLSVTVVEAAPRLMMRTLYPEIAAYVLGEHRHKGIDIRLGVTVAGVTEQGLTLGDGSKVDADLVLSSVGSEPRTDLATAAGLPCSNGVDTDACGRTADPSIFAIGDCAHWDHQGASTRHESVAATQFQARAIAAALTGKSAPVQIPFRLWSFQGKLRLQMSGQVLPDAETRIEQLEENSFLLRAFQDGNLIAIQALNAPRSFIAAIGELESGLTDRMTA
ncbi:NAD(P)/FAD-dependent oxidoreductase [Pseudomonas karstica]|nr:FAD-dependent oxidoreductase [Pseudomonas karstica]